MVRVGVIDSGGPAGDPAQDLARGRAFLADGSAVAARPDRLGHGTAVAAIIRRACPEAEITHAQIFDDRPVTSALRVAAALRWFASMPAPARPDVICMSLGLAHDRAPLRAACALTGEAGLLLVAAHPAQGAPCFPAAYAGVIAATGDARCGWDDLSEPREGVFGAWNHSPETGGAGGASLGAARVAGHLAARIAQGMTATEALRDMEAAILWRGAERRSAGRADGLNSRHNNSLTGIPHQRPTGGPSTGTVSGAGLPCRIEGPEAAPVAHGGPPLHIGPAGAAMQAATGALPPSRTVPAPVPLATRLRPAAEP